MKERISGTEVCRVRRAAAVIAVFTGGGRKGESLPFKKLRSSSFSETVRENVLCKILMIGVS